MAGKVRPGAVAEAARLIALDKRIERAHAIHAAADAAQVIKPRADGLPISAFDIHALVARWIYRAR